MAIKNQIQLRRGSSSEWIVEADGDGPILASGEPGFDLTNNILKLGNGTTRWKDLQPIGADQSLYKVKNTSGGIIYKGQVVRAVGTVGNSDAIQVATFIADGSVPEHTVMGLASQTMNNNDFGYVTAFGQISEIDTAPDNSITNICAAGETWADGDILYASPSVSGKLTKIKPQHETIIAIVLHAADNGSLFARPTWYPHMNDIHDVSTNGVSNNQYLIYNSATELWSPTSSGIFEGVDISSNSNGATLLNIEGTNGNLFSVIDSVSGSLLSVNDITGLPAFEVFSDHSIVAGRFNQNDFIISSSGNVGIGKEPNNAYKLDVKGKLNLANNLGDNVTFSVDDSGDLLIGPAANKSVIIPAGQSDIIFDTSNGGISTQGKVSATEGDFGNLLLKNNTLSSINNDGNILLSPNGDGNVGVGLSSPDTKLHVEQPIATLNPTNLTNHSAVGLSITMPDTVVDAGSGIAIALGMNERGRSYIGSIWDSSNKDQPDLAFYTTWGSNGVGERLRIKYDGKVGIGTDSPSTKLHVLANTDSDNGLYLQNTNSGTSARTSIFLNNGTYGATISLGSLGYTNNGFYRPSRLLINGPFITDYVTGQHIFHIGGGGSNQNVSGSTQVGVWDINALQAFNAIAGGPFNTSSLKIKSTTGVGTTDYISMAVGNNGATEAMRITNAGNVGIGNNAPTTKLDVSGVITATGGNSTQWNSAYDFVNSGGSVGGNIVVGGDLTVNGSTIVANVSSMEIEDPILTLGLASGNIITDDSYDRGIAMVTNDGTAFMGWDNSENRFVLLGSGVATNNGNNYDAGTYGDLYVGNTTVNQTTNGSGGLAIKSSGGTYTHKIYANSAGYTLNIDSNHSIVYSAASSVGKHTFNINGSIAWLMDKDGFYPSTATNSGASLYAKHDGYLGFFSLGNTFKHESIALFDRDNNNNYGLRLLYKNNTNLSNGVVLDNTGNVGVGTDTPTYKLQVNGSFGATTKSFRIDHPSKPNYTLEYGSLESPYHGVRLTGRGKVVKGVGVVDLPPYLKDLIHDDETINIQLTNLKHGKTLYVSDIDLNNSQFVVKADRAKTVGDLEFFWTFTGVRKDVPSLVVEQEK